MLRHALAHLLHAIADRIEIEQLEPEIQYVYVYNCPPATTVQPYPLWSPTITYSAAASGN